MPNYKPITKDSLILVVDDFLQCEKLLKCIKNQLGYQNIVEAEDGQLVLKHIGY